MPELFQGLLRARKNAPGSSVRFEADSQSFGYRPVVSFGGERFGLASPVCFSAAKTL
ncbi:MAG: hypothetical protein AB7F36_15940 [Reyranellaceae bacterium]